MGRKEREGYAVTPARHAGRRPPRPPTWTHQHRHRDPAKPPGAGTVIQTDVSTAVRPCEPALHRAPIKHPSTGTTQHQHRALAKPPGTSTGTMIQPDISTTLRPCDLALAPCFTEHPGTGTTRHWHHTPAEPSSTSTVLDQGSRHRHHPALALPGTALRPGHHAPVPCSDRASRHRHHPALAPCFDQARLALVPCHDQAT